MGGLPIPRDPSEIKGDFVFSSQGKDVTKEYQLGAQRALRIALKNDIRIALLKESSPSCGSFQVYNGEFTHEKIPGEGMTTKLLRKHNRLFFPLYFVFFPQRHAEINSFSFIKIILPFEWSVFYLVLQRKAIP